MWHLFRYCLLGAPSKPPASVSSTASGCRCAACKSYWLSAGPAITEWGPVPWCVSASLYVRCVVSQAHCVSAVCVSSVGLKCPVSCLCMVSMSDAGPAAAAVRQAKCLLRGEAADKHFSSLLYSAKSTAVNATFGNRQGIRRKAEQPNITGNSSQSTLQRHIASQHSRHTTRERHHRATCTAVISSSMCDHKTICLLPAMISVMVHCVHVSPTVGHAHVAIIAAHIKCDAYDAVLRSTAFAHMQAAMPASLRTGSLLPAAG
jgi:hypothetical protein